jgi:hypothetical protein
LRLGTFHYTSRTVLPFRFPLRSHKVPWANYKCPWNEIHIYSSLYKNTINSDFTNLPFLRHVAQFTNFYLEALLLLLLLLLL